MQRYTHREPIREALSRLSKVTDPLVQQYIEPDWYVLKPAVGACKSQFLKFQFTLNSQGKSCKEVSKHLQANIPITEWLLQPFIPDFPLAEYKVG